jgi:hypothetical protein
VDGSAPEREDVGIAGVTNTPHPCAGQGDRPAGEGLDRRTALFVAESRVMSTGISKRTVAVAVATLALGASMVACGEDEPAICSSADNLKASVDNLKDVDLTSSTGFSELESGLTTLENDLADVKTDAESEFSSEVATVDTSFAALQAAVDAAKATPTAKELAEAAKAFIAFGADVETLISDVQSTC